MNLNFDKIRLKIKQFLFKDNSNNLNNPNNSIFNALIKAGALTAKSKFSVKLLFYGHRPIELSAYNFINKAKFLAKRQRQHPKYIIEDIMFSWKNTSATCRYVLNASFYDGCRKKSNNILSLNSFYTKIDLFNQPKYNFISTTKISNSKFIESKLCNFSSSLKFSFVFF